MTNICLPKTTFSIEGQSEDFLLSPQTVLAIGQKTPSGSAISGELVKNIGNNSEENQLFGPRSMLAEMIRAFKRVDADTRIDAIALDDNPLGIKAEGFLELSGTASENSTIDFAIQSKIHHSFSINVSSGDSATDIINKMFVAITEDTTLNVLPEVDLTSFISTNGGLSVSVDNNQTYSNITTAEGLGSNNVRHASVLATIIYASTSAGLSVSTDLGASFVNRTTLDGLGSDNVRHTYAIASSAYVSTRFGLSISKDSGASFVNRTTLDGLGSDNCFASSYSGAFLYVATRQGLSISTDDGQSFINKTTLDGLGNNGCLDVVSYDNYVYVATSGGVSISDDNGKSFVNKTISDGLGANFVRGIYYDKVKNILYASTSFGLSISNNNGKSWENKVTSDGIASDLGDNVYAYLNDVYVAFLDATGLSLSQDTAKTWQTKTTADGLGSNNTNDAIVFQRPTLKLIASNAGEVGNNIGFSLEKLPPGISVKLFNGMGNLTPGSIDPDLTNVFDAIDGLRYQTIIWPANYDISVVKSLLENRFNSGDDVLDGMSISFDSLSKNDAKTYAQNADSEVIVFGPVKKRDVFRNSAPEIFEFMPGLAANYAAIRASRLSLGRNVGYLIPGTQINGSLGGPKYAAIPYQNTSFYELPVQNIFSGWSSDEIEELKNAGCYIIANNLENSSIVSGECVTTKQKPKNISFKFLNYVDTASVIREFFYKSNIFEYAQSELTLGDLVPGKRMANQSSIEVFQTRLYQRLSLGEINGVSYNLTQPGSDAIQFFKENLSVNINESTGTAKIFCVVPIVSQLRELDGVVEIVFDLSPVS